MHPPPVQAKPKASYDWGLPQFSIPLSRSIFVTGHNDELAPSPLENHSPDYNGDIRLHMVSEVYKTLIELLRRETEHLGGRVGGAILARTLV